MGHCVLLVDDEEVFSDLTRAQLTKRGFNVIVAPSGEEALEKARSQPRPDVILLDILLPGISGVDVLKALQSDEGTKDIPVIICSITVRERASIKNLMGMGARDFISKPCQPDELAQKLNATIKK